jgi:hypothetical protein
MGMQVREAKHFINTEDLPDYEEYRVLAVILSRVPAGTRFGVGQKNLRERLDRLLIEEKNPLIADNFRFKPHYFYCPAIYDLLSGMRFYGEAIGLENWGPDFIYVVTEKTSAVAREVRGLKLISEEGLEYLEGLGQKLADSLPVRAVIA